MSLFMYARQLTNRLQPLRLLQALPGQCRGRQIFDENDRAVGSSVYSLQGPQRPTQRFALDCGRRPFDLKTLSCSGQTVGEEVSCRRRHPPTESTWITQSREYECRSRTVEIVGRSVVFLIPQTCTGQSS